MIFRTMEFGLIPAIFFFIPLFQRFLIFVFPIAVPHGIIPFFHRTGGPKISDPPHHRVYTISASCSSAHFCRYRILLCAFPALCAVPIAAKSCITAQARTLKQDKTILFALLQGSRGKRFALLILSAPLSWNRAYSLT